MKIDVHTHGIHAERGADGKLVPPLYPVWKFAKLTPPEIADTCRKGGVSKVFLLDEAEVAFETFRTFGDFVIPVPRIDPDRETPESIDDLFKRGARGIKFIAPGHSYGDDVYFPLYRAILDNNGFAVFHTGYLIDEFFEPGGLIGRDHYTDLTLMRPAALDRICRAFPDLRILMSHFGNPWWEEAWKILSVHRNIRADFSGGTACRRDMRMWEWIFAPNGKLDKNAVERLCFGTDDTPFLEPDRYLQGDLFAFYEKFSDTLHLSQEQREKIETQNALELLG